MRRNHRLSLYVIVILSAVMVVFTGTSDAAANKREEILEKIKKLEAERAKLRKEAEVKTTKSKPVGKSLEEIVARYEKLLSNCTVKKSERCADVIYTLGGLYYDQGRDNYVKAREDYERAMSEYERNPRGPEPENPVPDYSKALLCMKDSQQNILIFPSSVKLITRWEIFALMGDLDRTKDVFTKIVEKFQTPASERISVSLISAI